MENEQDQTERLEITIYGRVQGVAFRFFTERQARSLGLHGWVRNHPDGSVQLVAEGERSALEALLDWTAHGPKHARVDTREVHWSAATGSFEDFNTRG